MDHKARAATTTSTYHPNAHCLDHFSHHWHHFLHHGVPGPWKRQGGGTIVSRGGSGNSRLHQ